MAKVQIIVCDVCGTVGKPTRLYTLCADDAPDVAEPSTKVNPTSRRTFDGHVASMADIQAKVQARQAGNDKKALPSDQ